MLESYIYACNKLDLNSEALILTRNPESFISNNPQIASSKYINFQKGDIRNFDFPKNQHEYIIHGATTNASETFNKQDPVIKYDTIFEGTRRTLDFAKICGCEKFLYMSSGSVYGKQPENILKIDELYHGAPFTNDKNFDHSILGEAKRASELLTSVYSEKFGIETKLARCFSFVGPYLPLDIHYAIGNFIRDAINSQPILIKGDGKAERSYMYASDLTIWLWTILFLGQTSEHYNVGSEYGISTQQLAQMISNLSSGKVEIIIDKRSENLEHIDRYIPSTAKARESLRLQEYTDLESAIKKTMKHIQNNKSIYGLL